jgi:hypothetical protein
MLPRLIVALLTIAFAGQANAQQVSGPFIGDLGWTVLRERLELAAPSPAQLENIAQIHSQYLEEMKSLRAEQIDPFLNETKGMGSITASDPDEARRKLAHTEKIRRGVAEQEAMLMDRIATVLGESQQAALERIREHRTRERLRHRPMDIIGGSTLPQAEPRFGIDWRALSDGERAALEATLTPWEDRYTSQLKRLEEARSRALVHFSETLATLNAAQAELGDTPPDPAEISRLINMFRDSQRTAQELTEPHKAGLQRHIVQGLRALAPLIPSDQRINVVRRSTQAALLPDRVTPMSRRASRLNLPPDVQAEIAHIVALWNDDATSLLINALEASWLDDAARQNVATDVDEDGTMSFDLPDSDHFNAARLAWTNRSDEALKAIASLVPEHMADALSMDDSDEPQSPTVVSSTAVVVTSGGGTEGDDDDAVVVTSETSSGGGLGGMFNDLDVLPPLRPSLIEGLARDLSLSGADRKTLDALFETHDAARAEMEATRIAEKKAKRESFEDRPRDLSDADRMAIAIEMMTPLSREGLAELDEAFFEGMTTLGASEAIEPWRLSRARQLLQGSGGIARSLQLVGVPDNRANVDLLDLVGRASLDDQEYTNAREALSSWHSPATAIMEDLQAMTIRLNNAMETMMSQSQEGGRMSIDLEIAMEVDKLQTDLTRKRSELSAITQESARAVEAAMTNADSFHRMWLLEAHPIAAGHDPFIKLFDRALDLDSLTGEQAASIAAVRIEHDGAWWSSTEDAIATIEAPRDAPTNQNEAFFSAQRIRQEVEQQTFARREAALKRLEQVRNLLTESQLAAVQGLPDPAAPRTAGVPF